MSLKAVLFDVDFTLIYPGPMFRGEGYQAFCARYGMDVDASKFEAGVASAAPLLDSPDDVYDPEIFIAYTRHIIEQMGGTGPRVDECSREIYDEWAACQHFELYDDVPAVLRAAGGRRPAHRPDLEHAPLPGVVPVAFRAAGADQRDGLVVRSRADEAASEHLLGGAAARSTCRRREAVMVGDSLRHDVEGALGVGMRAVLLNRGDSAAPRGRRRITGCR